MSAGFSERMRAAAEPSWSRSVRHRFVDELFSGAIADERLSAYLVQDYQFCDAFVALLGQAVASAPDLTARLGHAGQLGFFAGDENTYFTDSFDRLGVSTSDRVAPDLLPVTRQFAELMLRARDSRSYPRIVTVLTVAEWLYLDWAAADREWPPRPEHRGWIEVHHSSGFAAWVAWLRQELDHHEPVDATERAELQALFVEATELELAFFDAVYSDEVYSHVDEEEA